MVNLLLENHATNANAVNRDGHTALDIVNTDIEGKLKIYFLFSWPLRLYLTLKIYIFSMSSFIFL